MEATIEGLRDEIKSLSTSIFRIEFLRLTVLFLLPFTMVGAFHRLTDSSEKIKALAESIKSAEPMTGRANLGDLLHNPFWTGDINFLLPDSPNVSLESARSASRAQYEKLREMYRTAFAQKLSMMGTEIEVDLRVLIYAVPMGLILTQAYLFILRRKRTLLLFAGRCQSSDFQLLDRLNFGPEPNAVSKFYTYPGQLSETLLMASSICLLVYLMVASRPFWQGWIGGEDSFLANALSAALILFTSFAIYAGLYCEYVSRQLSNDLRLALGHAPPESAVENMHKRLKTWASWIRNRLGGALSLAMGSLLLGSTLLLATGMSDCGEPRAGYDLALGRRDTTGEAPYWFTAVVAAETEGGLDGDYSQRDHAQWVGVAMYRLSLIFALMSVGLLAFILFNKRKIRIANWALRISIGFAILILVYLLCEFAFVWPELVGFEYGIATGHIVWLVTAAVWVIPMYLRSLKAKARWMILARCIALLWVPIGLSNCLIVIIMIRWSIAPSHDSSDFKGLLSYYVAAFLLAHAYSKLLKDAEREPIAKLAGVPSGQEQRLGRGEDN